MVKKKKKRTIIEEEVTSLYTPSFPSCPCYELYHPEQEEELLMTAQSHDTVPRPVPSYYIADGAPVASCHQSKVSYAYLDSR